jgi:hypothetical protein
MNNFPSAVFQIGAITVAAACRIFLYREPLLESPTSIKIVRAKP